MLSKNDYKDYLNQIIEIENKMSAVYKECVDRIEDADLKKRCRGLFYAEIQHARLVEKLKELVSV